VWSVASARQQHARGERARNQKQVVDFYKVLI
jgi:hypothetical protein